ncbi:MAG: hypothetical protein ABR538_09590 [Candidatus Binatia bacterium]
MTIRYPILAAVAAYALLSGCNRIEFLPPSQNSAGTTLTVVKRGLSASSQGFRFLGILPLAFPSLADAEQKILVQAGVPQHDPNFVLVNKVKQTNTIYLFIASIHTMTLTADVAELHEAEPYTE